VSEAIYEIPLRQIDGTETTLGAYRGKVVLVVKCRFRLRANAAICGPGKAL